MSTTRLLTLALALYGAQALPHSKRIELDDAACVASIPSEPDADTVNKVYLAGVAQNVSLQVSFRRRLPSGDSRVPNRCLLSKH